MQNLTVRHVTTYRYYRPVTFGTHRLMLRPRDSHDLRLLEATLRISPTAQLRWVHDVYGNSVTKASFSEPAKELVIESQIVIERYSLSGPDFFIEPYAEKMPFSYSTQEVPDLSRTIERHYHDPDRIVNAWARGHLDAPDIASHTQAFLAHLTSAFRKEFSYKERHDPGVQTPVETLRMKSGSCRDFALLMMEAVRSVGLAARFVSGYLYDPAIDGNESDTVGSGSTHAWVQVYLPGAGWIEFDPTNGSAGGHNLVPVAVSRDPEQASPISGSFEGYQSDFAGMTVEVSVSSRKLR